MSDQPQLDSLTLKDLRKLAGEHQVPNRSTLNKKELLSALSQTLRGRLQSVHTSKDTGKGKPTAAARAETEPEVLDPAAVAGLTGATTSPRKPEARQSRASNESESTSENSSTESSGDDSGRNNEDGDTRKRRRRRRRRRGKHNDHADDHSNDQPNPDDTQEHPASKAEQASPEDSNKGDRRSPAPAPTSDTPPASKPRHDTAAPEDKQARPEKPGRDDKASSPPAAARTNQRGPSKPRLEGQQRSLPSVLDRLQTLSGGLIELCDPDTPSWAQARLGELLAEIGVVATPCQGLPHPRFHEVVGEEQIAGVEAGHISVVETPGFSLRGDRGDLFPLRKAQVKVAPGGSQQTPQEDGPQAQAQAPETKSAPSKDDKDSDQSEEKAKPQPRGESRRSRTRDKDDAPNPAAETIAEAEAEAELEAASQEEPPPRVRPGLRHKPADEAPPLPLVPIEAEELAARPKAEGFRDLGLNEQILADLHEMGFAQPSPIQAAAIPLALTGKDLIGQALTGTGKTAAFALPILHRLYEIEGQGPVALVLCPTRELARQVHHETNRMAGRSGARTALIYGGVPMDDQVEALSRNPHIVIGTPGRIIDHMKRGNLVTAGMHMVVLDEADQMLDIGFLPDITYILKHTPATRQTQLFSATMPEEIKRLGTDYMREPEHIHVMPESVTVDKVDQKFIAVDPDKKTKLLAHFIETKQPEQMVVFCKTKHQTDRVARVLKNKKLSAGAIHGDLAQNKRERTLRDFREGRLTCLIATNVAARGLDIPSVSHVVNYDVPETPEEYVHRIGRTGRMGKEGIARTFLTPEDGQFVVEIEKHIGLELEEEIVEGITATTAAAAPTRSIANAPNGSTPRLLKPIAGGIRLGRRRR